MDNEFEFIIASPFDRERLVCEIYYKNEIIAEISQETEELILELYPHPTEKCWKIPYVQFQKALVHAKNHLLNGKISK